VTSPYSSYINNKKKVICKAKEKEKGNIIAKKAYSKESSQLLISGLFRYLGNSNVHVDVFGIHLC